MSAGQLVRKLLACALLLGIVGSQTSRAQPRAPVVPATGNEGFAPLPPLRSDAVIGENLQHSLRLLAGLKCEGNRPVRVLFYGQSITEQGWWKTLARYIETSYPGTPIVIENRAIGGHASDLLVKTAEADLYAFNPDLVIFHVYGSHASYEAIIRRIRERTTADVLMATDHVVDDVELGEDTNSQLLWVWRWTRAARWAWAGHAGATWNAWWNYAFLPGISNEYGTELVDVRGRWKDYLRQNRFRASQLLADQVHLNTQGEYLMAEILKPYLNPTRLKAAACVQDRSREWVAGRDFQSHAGHAVLHFEGKRAELVLGRVAEGPILVRIDGRMPSEERKGYRFTRTTAYPDSTWPALLQLHFGPSVPVAETWTATIRQANDALTEFAFDVEGSVTGVDGSGTSVARFVSKSGRLSIEPSDWNLAYARAVFKQPLPDGFKIRWQVMAPGVDEIRAGTAPVNGVDAAHGLDNAAHTLELSGAGIGAVTAIRTYRPPLR